MKRMAIAVALLAAAGCSSSSDAGSATTKTSIGTASAGDLRVELLTEGKLQTGLSAVYVAVTTASGQPVTDAAVTLRPLMTMMNADPQMPPMTHSAPVVGTPTPDAEGDYHCHVVFQMPSSEMGIWSATVSIARSGAAPVEATFPALPVEETRRERVWTDPASGLKYVASFNFQEKPRVGMNPALVTLHVKGDAMGTTYPPVDDAVLSFTSTMPGMDHTRTDTATPVAGTPGVYEVQVGLSMPGDWNIAPAFSRSGTSILDPAHPLAPFATTL